MCFRFVKIVIPDRWEYLAVCEVEIYEGKVIFQILLNESLIYGQPYKIVIKLPKTFK